MKIQLKKDGLEGDALKFAQMLEAALPEFPAGISKEDVQGEIAKVTAKLVDENGNLKVATIEDLATIKGEFNSEVEGTIKNILKKHGEELSRIRTQGSTTKVKTLEEVIKEHAVELKKIQKQGYGNIEVNLKIAGVTSIADSVGTMSPAPTNPYLPGIDGPLFLATRNPNFILNYVNSGRTNLARLPWINESGTAGAATAVNEKGAKPLYQPAFNVELSTAKKAAALVTLTDEFEEDLPGLATQIRRMLQTEVTSVWDDLVQANVIAAADGFDITDFDGAFADPDLWAAIGVGIAQVTTVSKVFVPNVIALNPITAWKLNLQKGGDGHYIVPPFLAKIAAKFIETNKVAVDSVLIGDLSQYNVDVYKDYTLKMGFNADDFSRNQFSIVGEVRYHDYISDNRKSAIAYYDLNTVLTQITD